MSHRPFGKGDKSETFRSDEKGRPRITGTDLPWDDLRVSLNSTKKDGAKPPVDAAYKGSSVFAFQDQAVNEQSVHFVVQMPHAWKEGTDLYPHVHWVGEDNTAGNVRWELTYSWANIGSVFPAETAIYVDDANGVTDVHNMADFSSISGAGKTISSMLICRLTRNSSHANDTLTGKDAYGLEIDFHYQIDSMGSDTETAKDA